MRKTILLAAAISLILLGFLMSCELSGMSDVEFAKALMEEASDSTGLYSPPGKSVLVIRNLGVRCCVPSAHRLIEYKIIA